MVNIFFIMKSSFLIPSSTHLQFLVQKAETPILKRIFDKSVILNNMGIDTLKVYLYQNAWTVPTPISDESVKCFAAVCFIRIENLQPSTSYQFILRRIESGILGPFSDPSVSIITHPGARDSL